MRGDRVPFHLTDPISENKGLGNGVALQTIFGQIRVDQRQAVIRERKIGVELGNLLIESDAGGIAFTPLDSIGDAVETQRFQRGCCCLSQRRVELLDRGE